MDFSNFIIYIMEFFAMDNLYTNYQATVLNFILTEAFSYEFMS